MPEKKSKSAGGKPGIAVAKELAQLGRMVETLVKDSIREARGERGEKIKKQAKRVLEAGKEDTKGLRRDFAKGLKVVARELSKIASTIEK